MDAVDPQTRELLSIKARRVVLSGAGPRDNDLKVDDIVTPGPYCLDFGVAS